MRKRSRRLVLSPPSLCHSCRWDSKGTGQPAILSNGGNLQVRGCAFQRSHPGGQVLLGAGSGKVSA